MTNMKISLIQFPKPKKLTNLFNPGSHFMKTATFDAKEVMTPYYAQQSGDRRFGAPMGGQPAGYGGSGRFSSGGQPNYGMNGGRGGAEGGGMGGYGGGGYGGGGYGGGHSQHRGGGRPQVSNFVENKSREWLMQKYFLLLDVAFLPRQHQCDRRRLHEERQRRRECAQQQHPHPHGHVRQHESHSAQIPQAATSHAAAELR